MIAGGGVISVRESTRTSVAQSLAKDWGCASTVELYLDACQVDTPDHLVEATWQHVHARRDGDLELVVDFGAGDGRFARHGRFCNYLGFEVDPTRIAGAALPANASLIEQCAFSADAVSADLCIGNPPFVRNQHLPKGWRRSASAVIHERTGVAVSGLANAWQYFFFLALSSVKADGLCALVVPYEWVSRPSAKALRDYIRTNKWNVDVYRLVDDTFDSVLTTASITIIDKAQTDGTWRYFEEGATGVFRQLASETGSPAGAIQYLRRNEVRQNGPRAVRGLSPGTQKLLTLTEPERARLGLKIGEDVVACVTTLRHLPTGVSRLDEATFNSHFRDAGQLCWLLQTNGRPSRNLQAYLDSTNPADRASATCMARKEWWRFPMPKAPEMLISQSFRDRFPKLVDNVIAAVAVGAVTGLHGLDEHQKSALLKRAATVDLNLRVVAHSNGLRKVEINQLNALLPELLGESPDPS